MRQFSAVAIRIILVFVRRFGLALLLSVVATGSAHAQAGFSLRMGLDFKGQTYQVAQTSIPAGQRTELNVSPIGGLRVYVRAIALPGVDGQVLLDVQVFEPHANTQSQITSFTMTAYLGSSDNATSMKTVYGDLALRAYVDAASASAPAAAAVAPPKPVYKPIRDDAPVRPLALPAPLPSPLPTPTN